MNCFYWFCLLFCMITVYQIRSKSIVRLPEKVLSCKYSPSWFPSLYINVNLPLVKQRHKNIHTFHILNVTLVTMLCYTWTDLTSGEKATAKPKSIDSRLYASNDSIHIILRSTMTRIMRYTIQKIHLTNGQNMMWKIASNATFFLEEHFHLVWIFDDKVSLFRSFRFFEWLQMYYSGSIECKT